MNYFAILENGTITLVEGTITIGTYGPINATVTSLDNLAAHKYHGEPIMLAASINASSRDEAEAALESVEQRWRG